MNRTDRQCCIVQCSNRVHSREMCRKHYQRWHIHGDANHSNFIQSPAGAPLNFIESTSVTGEGCLTWPFGHNGVGYAQINVKDKKKVLVSRIMCERANGPAPSPAHQAAHSCGKGHQGCVAPWHLVWKTPKGNNHDMDQHGTRSRGDKHARKLSSKAVSDIKLLLDSVPQGQIAARFGVSQTMISRIARGKAWATPVTLSRQQEAA